MAAPCRKVGATQPQHFK